GAAPGPAGGGGGGGGGTAGPPARSKRVWPALRLLGREELGHPVEELIEHHLGDAAQHALTDAGDEAADLHVGVVAHARAAIDVGELHARVAPHEAGRAAALDHHAVAMRRLEVAQLDLALERALDGGDPDLHRGLVLV